MRRVPLPRRPLPWGLAPLLALALLGAGSLVAAPPDPAPDTLTIERIFTGPPFTGPGPQVGTWCPDGDAWWTQWAEIEGRRTLCAVDAEQGTRRPLLAEAAFDDDAGSAPEAPYIPMEGIGRTGPPEFFFTPDGKGLVVARNGDLHHLDLATRVRTRLTRTREPIRDVRMAPDGTGVSFARAHDLWVVRWGPEGVREQRLTQDGSDTRRNAGLDWVYPEELDATTAAWWSPDATRIAFLRLDESGVSRHALADPSAENPETRTQFFPRPGERNPVPSVGLVGLDGAAPTWLDLGGTDLYVPWVAWIPRPSGARLLVAVLDRAQEHFEARLFAADGTAEGVLWTEDDPRWVDVPPPPRPLPASGDLLWRSRRDGFWRLYRQPGAGGEARPLTPGGTEMGALLAVDEAAGTFLYEGATADRLRTTLLRARLDGEGAPEVLLDAGLQHAVTASPSGRWLLDVASRACQPPETTLRRADGAAVRVLARETTPAYEALEIAPPEFVEVPTPDGTRLSAMLWKPVPFDPAKRHPVVVHVYGGPGSSLVRDAWRGAGTLFAARLARDGFFVFAVDGRGTGGRGKAFETYVHRRLGLVELADQVAAARWLAERPGVDGERIGIWGWSFGGTMACLAMVHAPEVFRAAVAVAPVTDWRFYDTIYTERYLDTPAENRQGYEATSVLAHAKEARGALLLVHGLSDDNVHVGHTLRLSTALLAARRPFDQMLYPGRGHGIEGVEEHLDVYRRVRAHFHRYLRADGPR